MFLLYRALLARTGAVPLALACAVGWVAFASYGLAIILLVHSATGSFALAGGAVAAFSAGSALAAPLRGRLIDRRGPGALAIFGMAHAGALAMLVAACVLAVQALVLLSTAAIAGALAPPLIATARALWPDVAGARLTRAAHSLNAGLADAGQLLGPALTSAVAAASAPSLALAVLVGGASAAAGTVACLGRRGHVAAARPTARRFWGVMRESSGLRTLVACNVAGGLWAGALEVAVTALGARDGAAELAAVPLSAAAVGGMIASVWIGSRAGASPAGQRYVRGSLVVGMALALTPIRPSLASITALTALAGGGYGVLGAALFELLDLVVAPDRAVEAFTWLTTGQAAGSAAGAALAGALAPSGTDAPFALVAGCAVAAAAIPFIRRRTFCGPHEAGRARST